MGVAILAAFIAILAIGFVLGVAVGARVQSSLQRWQDTARLQRIERKLDRISAHLGLPEDTTIPEAIRAELLAGNKINAIKLYREQHGVGLKEAKDAVEHMQETM